MRLLDTPDGWRPAGRVVRHRSFDHLGYPTFTIGFGLVAFAVSAAAWAQVLRRALRSLSRIELPVLAIALVAALVGLACAFWAARRLLVGHDGAIEVDPAARMMLVLPRGGEPLILPFHAISALAVNTWDQPYTSGRLVRHASIVALPSGTELLAASGENLVSRDLAVQKMRALARKIASVLGVPVQGA